MFGSLEGKGRAGLWRDEIRGKNREIFFVLNDK